MLSRIAVSSVFLMLILAAVHAQETRPTDDEQLNQQVKPSAKDTPPVPTTLPPQDPPPQAAPPTQGPRPRAYTPSERCGAVAYTADGAFGGAYGIDTCEDAERLAVDECRRESTDKADCSRGVVKRTNTWFYIQFCQRGSDWGTHISEGRTMAEANEAAAQYARRSQYGPENCRLVPNGLFHSGGLHTRM